jgi:hypothetical protein
MVNNLTNISKTNNYLSPCLNEQKRVDTTTYNVGNQDPDFGRALLYLVIVVYVSEWVIVV